MCRTSNTTPRRGATLARFLLASALLLTTTLVGSVAVQTGPAAAAGVFVQIRNVRTNQCIQPQSNVESLLEQDDCDRDNLAQRWFFVKNSNGNHIVNQLSGLCVYMNGPVESGSPVIQTRCGTVSNYDWQNAAPPSVSRIISRAGHENTDLCLAPSHLVGGSLKISDCLSATIHRWQIGSRF